MFNLREILVLAFLLSIAVPAFAEDKCIVKAVLGGTAVTMKHCAAAFYDSETSVTLVFSDSPFTDKQIAEFQESSNPPEQDTSGKARTMIHFAFCPGGGKSVEMSVNVGSSPLLGFQNTFELPKDKAIVNIEKLSGDFKLGGRIAGRITGGKTSDGREYSWQADFDMKLPTKPAFGGQGCGN